MLLVGDVVIEDDQHVGMGVRGVVAFGRVAIALGHQQSGIDAEAVLHFETEAVLAAVTVDHDVRLTGLLVDVLDNGRQFGVAVGGHVGDVEDVVVVGIGLGRIGSDLDRHGLQLFDDGGPDVVQGLDDVGLTSRLEQRVGLQSAGQLFHEVVGRDHGGRGAVADLVDDAEADVLEHRVDGGVGGILELETVENGPAVLSRIGEVAVVDDGGVGVGAQRLADHLGGDVGDGTNGLVELVVVDQVHAHADLLFEIEDFVSVTHGVLSVLSLEFGMAESTGVKYGYMWATTQMRSSWSFLKTSSPTWRKLSSFWSSIGTRLP